MSELPLIAVTDSASCPRPLAEQIERLTKLTELRLDLSESVTSLDPLAGLTELRTLNLTNYSNTYSGLTDLSASSSVTARCASLIAVI